MIQAVVFDLDGVLFESEQIWDEAREQLVRERGGRWHERAQQDMMGMSSPEWSRYMHEQLGLPLVPGAREAVERMASRWPLGLASSSNRPIIELALELAELARFFRVTVSSEEVERGKPAPDVYLEAARRLGVEPRACAAIEDSRNGIRSARAASMCVVAIPNRTFPPDADTLAQAAVVISSLEELSPETVSACE